MTLLASDTHALAHPGIIEATREAVEETLSTICGGETTYQEREDDTTATDSIWGIIGFVGDVAWTLMLGLPRQTAADLTLAFVGCELEYDGTDLSDAVGELANVIAGDLVARLEAREIRAAMSLPTVARGNSVELLLPHEQCSRRMHFDCPQGPFWVKIAIARPEEGGTRRAACPHCGR